MHTSLRFKVIRIIVRANAKCYRSRGKRMTHTANETLGRFLAGILLRDSFPVDREVERHDTKKK